MYYKSAPNHSDDLQNIFSGKQNEYKLQIDIMSRNILNLQTKINRLEKVKKIKKIMPSDDLLFDIAEVFKVFGDTTRMKIISALLEAELCVGDIAEITNSTQSAISHQLRVLKSARLVKFRRAGKVIYYSLDDEHVKLIFEAGYRHIMEDK